MIRPPPVSTRPDTLFPNTTRFRAAVDDLHPAVRPAAVIDVTRRQAEVLGGGPRIGPMPVEALNGDLLAIIERMIEVNDTLQSREKSMLTELIDRKRGV